MTTEALWALGRGTGVVALVCFTVTMVLGITTRSGRAPRSIGRFGVAELHRTAALTGTLLIAVHVGTLLFDPYAQLKVVDFLVPFVGSFRPLWQGLGTLAVDLLLVVVATSLLRDRVGPKVFRTVHLSTYALWPIAMAHALGNGTDRTNPAMLGLAAGCVVTVVSAVGWRLSAEYAERGQRRTARRLVAS